MDAAAFDVAGVTLSAPQAGFAWQAWHFQDLHRCPWKLGDELGRMDAAAFDLAGVASDEHEVTRRLLRQREKFAFHHSFGRPTGTKRREGCFGNVKNLHFTTVLGVPRARSDETVASAT